MSDDQDNRAERLNKYLRANKEMFADEEAPKIYVAYLDVAEREVWTDEDVEALYGEVCRGSPAKPGDTEDKEFEIFLNEAPSIGPLLKLLRIGSKKKTVVLLQHLQREYPEVYSAIEEKFADTEWVEDRETDYRLMSLDDKPSTTGRPPAPYRKVVLELYFIMRFVLGRANRTECITEIAELMYKYGWLQPPEDDQERQDTIDKLMQIPCGREYSIEKKLEAIAQQYGFKELKKHL